jgi:hypothetical protein
MATRVVTSLCRSARRWRAPMIERVTWRGQRWRPRSREKNGLLL